MKKIDSFIQSNIATVKARIARALQQSGREQDSVSIVAVTKRHPVHVIQAVVKAGIVDVGESYVQEALQKQAEYNDPRIRWHFIGQVQSNKCQLIAEHFSWVHSVSSVKVAMALSRARSARQDPLNICVQINLMNEPQKSGITQEGLEELLHCVMSQPTLHLRGLMCIPPRLLSREQLCEYFESILQLKAVYSKQGIEMDVLSMGMSNDYELAVQSGSTIVRIGQGIVGGRK